MKKINSKKWMKKLSVIGLSVGSVFGMASAAGFVNQPVKHGLSSKKVNDSIPAWKTDTYNCPKLLANLTYSGQVIHNAFQPISIQYVESGNVKGFNIIYFTNGKVDTAKSVFYHPQSFEGTIVADKTQNIVAAALVPGAGDATDGFAYLIKSDSGTYSWNSIVWNSSKGLWEKDSNYSSELTPASNIANYNTVITDLDNGLCPVMTYFDSTDTTNGQKAYQFNLNFNTGFNYSISLLKGNAKGISDIYRTPAPKLISFQDAKAQDFLPVLSSGRAARKSYLISSTTSNVLFEDSYSTQYKDYRETSSGRVINNNGNPNSKLYVQNGFNSMFNDSGQINNPGYGAYIDDAGELYTFYIYGNDNDPIVKEKANIKNLGYQANDTTYLNVTEAGNGYNYISLADKTKHVIQNFIGAGNGIAIKDGSEKAYKSEEMGFWRYTTMYKGVESNIIWKVDDNSSNLYLYYQTI